ncbi:MAG: hypothetical protein LC126_22810 [Bryobacterales bacterium]|nr:hypothetical protein [Bryobacterales bacterium]
MSLRVCLTLLIGFSLAPHSFAADGDDSAQGSQEIIDRYVQASQSQQQQLRGVTMDVEISAELPKLKKKGRMFGLRTITRLGRITYDAIKFEGDNTIKKEVIARFLTAETAVADNTPPPITPQYYKFKYRGLVERDSRRVYLFQISPRKKKVGTFKGEMWLDKDTALPIREAGRLSKNPSVFIKQFDFVRVYDIRDGVAYPKQTTGVVATRLWGKAEVFIDFHNFTKIPADQANALTSESSRNKTPR